jgi:hypothetical protein
MSLYEEGLDIAPDKKKPVWEKWFAWKPVRVHGKLVWLRTVYRTFGYDYLHGLRYIPRYGTILDVLKDS